MPEIRVSKTITGVEVEALWEIATDIAAYPTFIDSVVSVDVLERSDAACTKSDWTVLFNGNELQWTENDLFDRANRRISFEQIEGDLAEWSGCLEFNQADDAILATYVVRFDLGLPALSHLLHPLGEASVRDGCQQMLDGLEARATGLLDAA